uniref:histidine kinase n=1 Tax=Catharanthus roseus TaxID=4058 RepID=Q8L8I6_CATRO|nr:cytokinin receptor [Catharanthus roseus]
MQDLRKTTRDQCDNFWLRTLKMCWCVHFGVALSCQVPKCCGKVWRYQKQKSVEEQPLNQQPQLLQHFHQQQIQNTSRSTGKWWKTLLVVFVLAGIFGSMWLFWYLSEDSKLRRKETLASMCDERARMLQDQFNVSLNHVHALAILVSTFYHGKEPWALDQQTFEDYTEKTAFERPLTSGVAYALRVLHSEREKFEKQQGWIIRKMDTEVQTLGQDLVPEKLEPAPVQTEYAPVIFAQKTVSHIVSIDMMSGKEDRENILRARASGKGVLTSPFKLLKSNHLGVVLTFAVYNTDLPPEATREQRINATVGYLGASYDVPSLVEKLLHQLASKQTIAVNVYDTTDKSAPIKMYGDAANDTGLPRISQLDFGDPSRKHEMHCRFKQKPPPPWTAIIASVGVLVITLLLGHIFHAAINRIAKVERDYREMMALKHRAEAADIAKSQFLATVSHEIRTPMVGVLGMLQMLMGTNLDVKQLDYAETAHASGKDLISLINEVLDQAKIESGRLELEAVPFDLRADLDKVVSLLSGKSHEKDIELAVYVSDQVPEVVIGDPGRFRQIITNLVGNSIKFTKDKGHIFVSVHLADEVKSPLDIKDEVLKQSLTLIQDRSTASFNTLSGFPVVDRWRSWEKFKNLSGMPEESKKIKLLVTVEDTGDGIVYDAQDRIFTPFVQADSSTSRKYGGTGIGLSISKRLVDLVGGEIGFVSEPGTGSTFSFTAAFTKAETITGITKWEQYDLAVSEFRGLKALVVDEKSIRAEVTRYQLKRLEVSVDIASTVEAAYSHLSADVNSSASERVSMVLIDEDSWDNEIMARYVGCLKKSDQTASRPSMGMNPKIFLLANPKSFSDCIELKSTGLVDNVLTKPLRLSILISCLQESIGFGRTRQVTRSNPSTIGNLLKGKRMLVVDDNPVNRKVAELALRKYGAVVTCEASGEAALQRLKPPHDFDACFMDLQMPEMDGFEATQKIRHLEREYNENVKSGEIGTDKSTDEAYWHTPILAMTADLIQATNEKCRKCGMDGYVSKPFDDEQLYSAVAPFFKSG